MELSKILPNFNFFIIGYGPLFEKIRLKKERYGLQNLVLLGKQTNILKYLYESDLYLSTSLYEGHPISILEAMSIGLPIIATNVTGNNDTIVHGESGFFYELGSIQEASKYIKLISKNINLLKAMGTKSYERQRQKFSVQEMCSNTSNLYKKIYKDTLIN